MRGDNGEGGREQEGTHRTRDEGGEGLSFSLSLAPARPDVSTQGNYSPGKHVCASCSPSSSEHCSSSCRVFGLGRVKGTSLQKCRPDVKAASASARRRVHIDANTPRTHTHTHARARAHTPLLPLRARDSLSAAGETHLRIGNSR